MLRLDLPQPSDPGTDHHATTKRVIFGEVDSRVLDRIDSGHERKLREAIELLFVTEIDITGNGPIDDLSAKANPEVSGVKTAQRPNPALAIADASPYLRDLATKRRDRAQSCYDDAPFHE